MAKYPNRDKANAANYLFWCLEDQKIMYWDPCLNDSGTSTCIAEPDRSDYCKAKPVMCTVGQSYCGSTVINREYSLPVNRSILSTVPSKFPENNFINTNLSMGRRFCFTFLMKKKKKSICSIDLLNDSQIGLKYEPAVISNLLASTSGLSAWGPTPNTGLFECLTDGHLNPSTGCLTNKGNGVCTANTDTSQDDFCTAATCVNGKNYCGASIIEDST